MGDKELEIMTTYGKVKVKRTSSRMDEVPEDCGYMQQFEYNVDMSISISLTKVTVTIAGY